MPGLLTGLAVDPPAACLLDGCSTLKRYMHYLTRYEANLRAFKMEDKLRRVGAGCWVLVVWLVSPRGMGVCVLGELTG